MTPTASTAEQLRRCPNCGRPKPPIHWYRSGKTRCRNRFAWTQGRLFRLMTLLEQGWSDERIAQELGTTANGVNIARKRHGIPSRSRQLLSCESIAAKMGIPCPKTVRWWIEQGWLKGRKGQPRGGSRQWFVRPDALHRFLGEPAHWPAWEPARVADEALRRYVASVRPPERYLSQTEVAARLCVETQTVQQWITKGWLPAVRAGKGNRRIRESDLVAFERPGFVRRRAVVDAIALLGRRGLNVADIGRLYGTSGDYVGELAAGKREPLASVAARFALIVRETAYLPEGDAPAFGKHPPMPGFDDLVARVRPMVRAIPLRRQSQQALPPFAGLEQTA